MFMECLLTCLCKRLHRGSSSLTICTSPRHRMLMLMQRVSGLTRLLKDVSVECVLSRGEMQTGEGEGSGG